MTTLIDQIIEANRGFCEVRSYTIDGNVLRMSVTEALIGQEELTIVVMDDGSFTEHMHVMDAKTAYRNIEHYRETLAKGTSLQVSTGKGGS